MVCELLIRLRHLIGVSGPTLNEFANAPIERIQPQNALFWRDDKTRGGIRLHRQELQLLDTLFSVVRSSENLSNLHNRLGGLVQAEKVNHRIAKNVIQNLRGFFV